MRFSKSFSAAVLGLMAFCFLALATPAQAQHPHYLHALSNLRQARALLLTDNRPAFIGERDHAIDEIDKAIREVKMASIEEGRDPHFTPPPATAGDPYRPMRSALGLLDEAFNDISRGFGEFGDRGLQDRSLRHIDEARHALGHALHEMDRDHDRGRDYDRDHDHDRDHDRRY